MDLTLFADDAAVWPSAGRRSRLARRLRLRLRLRLRPRLALRAVLAVDGARWERADLEPDRRLRWDLLLLRVALPRLVLTAEL